MKYWVLISSVQKLKWDDGNIEGWNMNTRDGNIIYFVLHM